MPPDVCDIERHDRNLNRVGIGLAKHLKFFQDLGLAQPTVASLSTSRAGGLFIAAREC